MILQIFEVLIGSLLLSMATWRWATPNSAKSDPFFMISAKDRRRVPKGWQCGPLLCFIVAASLLVTNQASASPLACESIHNTDARYMCRALATGKKLFCESIKDSDLRAECRARTK